MSSSKNENFKFARIDFILSEQLSYCRSAQKSLFCSESKRVWQFYYFVGRCNQNVITASDSKFTSCRITLKAPEGNSSEGALRVIIFSMSYAKVRRTNLNSKGKPFRDLPSQIHPQTTTLRCLSAEVEA